MLLVNLLGIVGECMITGSVLDNANVNDNDNDACDIFDSDIDDNNDTGKISGSGDSKMIAKSIS